MADKNLVNGMMLKGIELSIYERSFPIKEKPETNETLKQYIAWAKHQLVCTRMVGPEFVNTAMEEWYDSKGIEFIVPGPDASSTNLAERAIQFLRDMMKSMLVGSGLPRSFWPDALRNTLSEYCVELLTRGHHLICSMVNVLIHHIRTFGALVYAHISRVLRKKMANNCEIGYSLGYAEDRIGTKVYFPQDHVARVVLDVPVD
ncbi:Gag-pol Polyprotein [Phytophthora megakarya]|uniref:Gag-pol Polyprotein n=1 Tax=Phytophthora megakarya TaxID=4795 RepID=A0A225UY73_9STRA|nr:Gag-pol Polyprotein [Phytophthora megakarya]